MRSGAPRPAFFGRPFEPLLLGLTLTMVIVALANWSASDRGTQYPLSVVVALAASVAAITLVIGWCCKARRLVEYGLLAVVLAVRFDGRNWSAPVLAATLLAALAATAAARAFASGHHAHRHPR
jgi:hypothetical protein